MSLPTVCDHEMAAGRYCDQPATVFALSATQPDAWASGASRACLAGFCSVEHAKSEEYPARDDAWATYHEVLANGIPATDPLADAWRRALAAWPEPVSASK